MEQPAKEGNTLWSMLDTCKCHIPGTRAGLFFALDAF